MERPAGYGVIERRQRDVLGREQHAESMSIDVFHRSGESEDSALARYLVPVLRQFLHGGRRNAITAACTFVQGMDRGGLYARSGIRHGKGYRHGLRLQVKSWR